MRPTLVGANTSLAKMQTATTSTRHLPAVHSVRGNQHWLTIPVPNGWDDVRPLTAKVLLFGDRTYAFRSWDSDRNEAYFLAQSVAKISC
jgi:hypothetical protein